mgnify:CR=1 FL=1
MDVPGPDPAATRAFGDTIDFGRTAGDYGRHRLGFPPRLFAELTARGLVRPDTRALDLGTGTGTVARGLAVAGMRVTASDPAAAMMKEARRLDAEAGVAIDYVVGRAEAIDAVDGTFDLVTAGQCWHWFDRPVAAGEVFRVLRPGGGAVIAHLDWIPLPGNVVAATEALILAHNPAWTMSGGSGLYPPWLADLATAGFTEIETFSFDVSLPYSPEAWRGRIRASAGIRASLDTAATERFDAELAALLARDFPGEELAIPHRVWAVTGRKRG